MEFVLGTTSPMRLKRREPDQNEPLPKIASKLKAPMVNEEQTGRKHLRKDLLGVALPWAKGGEDNKDIREFLFHSHA